MNEVEKFNDLLNCPIDLLDVLVSFHELKEYSQFLDTHLNWSRKVDLQSLRNIDGIDFLHEFDRIAHKYDYILPVRFAYSYVVQYCTCLESGLRKILLFASIKNGRFYSHSKTEKLGLQDLLKLIFKEFGRPAIINESIVNIVKIRNKIVHDNGRVSFCEVEKWSSHELCAVEYVLGEHVIVLNVENFFQVQEETYQWLKSLCRN